MTDSFHNTLQQLGISSSSLDRIRLARGVVGKSSYVAGIAILALGSVAWVLRDPNLLIVDAALVVLIFCIYFFGVIWFAHKHPGTALLEGAELIQWQQMEMAAKDVSQHDQIQNAAPKMLGSD